MPMGCWGAFRGDALKRLPPARCRAHRSDPEVSPVQSTLICPGPVK